MAIINMHMKFEIEIPKETCSGNHVVYRQTDGWTDKVNPVYPPSNFVGRGYNDIWKQICVYGNMFWHAYMLNIWVRSWSCGCLVTWFCYHLIAKPGNKTAAHSWPDPYISLEFDQRIWRHYVSLQSEIGIEIWHRIHTENKVQHLVQWYPSIHMLDISITNPCMTHDSYSHETGSKYMVIQRYKKLIGLYEIIHHPLWEVLCAKSWNLRYE